MKIRLGTRKDSMSCKYRILKEKHRWWAWYPVVIEISESNPSGYHDDTHKELHCWTYVERQCDDEVHVWFFPNLWIFKYEYSRFDIDNPVEDTIPDQTGKFSMIEINKILRNYIYDRKLRKKIPAVRIAYEQYQTLAGLSFDDDLRKQD